MRPIQWQNSNPASNLAGNEWCAASFMVYPHNLQPQKYMHKKVIQSHFSYKVVRKMWLGNFLYAYIYAAMLRLCGYTLRVPFQSGNLQRNRTARPIATLQSLWLPHTKRGLSCGRSWHDSQSTSRLLGSNGFCTLDTKMLTARKKGVIINKITPNMFIIASYFAMR